MVFSGFSFLFFFLPTTMLLYYAIPMRSWRNVVLLTASIFFYAWGEPVHVVLMLASIFINWLVALGIWHHHGFRKTLLAGGITINIFTIGFFKYSSFLVQSLNQLLAIELPVPNYELPIGISFYTLQAISYLIDTYRRSIIPQQNILFFGTYLSMFPQLIAGPIVRYKTVQNDLLNRTENINDFASGLRRFIIGLSKKLLIADTMGIITDSVLETEPTVGALPAWFSFVAYSFQIYFDFSGYSDMAIGLGRMMGFHFLENFNYPYTSKSLTEFWRRWHISLSSFFRDYIYIPLGGNRVSTTRWTINVLLVWSLTGLWHGANWNFICWGAYHGFVLMIEKLCRQYSQISPPPIARHIYTLFVITIGWVIFRIENFSSLIEWLKALSGGYGIGSITTLNALNVLHLSPWFLLAAIGSTPLPAYTINKLEMNYTFNRIYDFTLIFILIISLMSGVSNDFNPFIYFRF